MFMYGRKEIGMLLTTNMEIMNVWKFLVKEMHKKSPQVPDFRGHVRPLRQRMASSASPVRLPCVIVMASAICLRCPVDLRKDDLQSLSLKFF